jgi:hypothetical protein
MLKPLWRLPEQWCPCEIIRKQASIYMFASGSSERDLCPNPTSHLLLAHQDDQLQQSPCDVPGLSYVRFSNHFPADQGTHRVLSCLVASVKLWHVVGGLYV